MRRTIIVLAFATTIFYTSQSAQAGIVDPNCTAEKAAKSTATKAAVGVGGRCSPAEAAKDTAKNATGLDKDKNDKDKKDKDKDKKDKDTDKSKAQDEGNPNAKP